MRLPVWLGLRSACCRLGITATTCVKSVECMARDKKCLNIHSFIHSLTHLFPHSLAHTDSFTHSFIHLLMHSCIHAFFPSFIHAFIYSFTRCICMFPQGLTYTVLSGFSVRAPVLAVPGYATQHLHLELLHHQEISPRKHENEKCKDCCRTPSCDVGGMTPPTTQLGALSQGEYALQPTREDTHYRCALVGALQHQANIPVTIAAC